MGTNTAIYWPIFGTTRNLLVFFQHDVEKTRNGFSTYGAKYWVVHPVYYQKLSSEKLSENFFGGTGCR